MTTTEPKVLRRKVHIPVYWLIVGVFVTFVSPPLSVYASVQIANKARVAAQTQADRQAAAAREENRVLACGWFSAMLDMYAETPLTQAQGRVRDTYLQFYKISNCQPPRTR